jgi:hypothetical protein
MLRTIHRPASMRAPIEVGRRELRRAVDRNGHARRSAGRKLAALSLECEALNDLNRSESQLAADGQALPRRSRLLRDLRGLQNWSMRRRVGWL